MKYYVYDSGKLADASHPSLQNATDLVKKPFQSAIFDTFDGAVEYAHKWLGPLLSPKSPERLVVNEKYFYFKNNFYIEIVSSKTVQPVKKSIPNFEALVGKTVTGVDASACNVVHLDFKDGSSASITYDNSSIPGLYSLVIQPKWSDSPVK